MKQLILAINISETKALHTAAKLLKDLKYVFDMHPGQLRFELKNSLALTELTMNLELQMYTYKDRAFLRILKDHLLPVDSVKVIQTGMVADYQSVDLSDTLVVLWNLIDQHPNADLQHNAYLQGITEELSKVNQRETEYSERRRGRGDGLGYQRGRDIRDAMDDRDDRSSGWMRMESRHDRVSDRVSFWEREEQSNRKQLVFNEPTRRTVTERPLHPVLPFSRRKTRAESRALALGLFDKDYFTTNNVWVGKEKASTNSVATEVYNLHIGNDVFPMSIDDNYIIFKDLEQWLMYNVVGYGNELLDLHIVQLALGNMGITISDNDLELEINKPDIKVLFKSIKQPVDKEFGSELNKLEHYTAENVCAINYQKGSNSFVLGIDAAQFKVDIDGKYVVFNNLDSYLKKHAFQYGTGELYFHITKLALASIGINLKDNDVINYDASVNNLVLIGREKFVVEANTVTNIIHDSGNVKWSINGFTGECTGDTTKFVFKGLNSYLMEHRFSENVSRDILKELVSKLTHTSTAEYDFNITSEDVMVTMKSLESSKVVDRDAGTAIKTDVAKDELKPSMDNVNPLDITKDMWEQLLTNGNQAFLGTDMRKTVDARLIAGILFLREHTVISPVDWTLRAGALVLEIHAIEKLSAYRRGNYVNCILEAFELSSRDVAGINLTADQLHITFKTVKVTTQVTKQYLKAYNIVPNDSVAQQPVVETTPVLPTPKSKMTSAEIIEAINESDDCTNVEKGLIEYHEFGTAGVIVKLVDDGGVKQSIVIEGLLDHTAKGRVFVFGDAVNALGNIMKDLFVDLDLTGDIWVASTRGNNVVLRNYEELKDVPSEWIYLDKDQSIETLTHVLMEGVLV